MKPAKSRNPLALLFGWLALAGSPAHSTYSAEVADATLQQTGSIVGRVRNSSTGTYMAGVSVRISGASNAVTTDRTGLFSINDVPTGKVILVVSAPEFDSQSHTVDVQAGTEANIEIALTSGYYQLEAINVTTAREGTARAINDQRAAPNIVNVTASDAFGTLRDGNVGELVARMPGVAVLYVSNDIRSVMVRGIDSSLGVVTVDGLPLANSESAAMSRSFQWDQSSADNIETVTVTKAPTPDGDASAIGGAIDLKSKSAFDNSDRRRTEIRFGANYETVKDLAFPTANISHKQIFGSESRLGVAVNFGYSQHNTASSGSVLAHVISAGTTPLRQANIYDYPSIGERVGGGARVDYRLAKRTTVFAGFSYTYATNSVRSPSTFRRFNLVTAADGSTVAPGFSDDYAQWNPASSTIARMVVGQTPKVVNTRTYSGGLDHQWGDWKLTGLASYSWAQTRYDHPKYGMSQLQVALPNVGLILDRRNRSPYFPSITQVSGPDIYRLENYRAETLTQHELVSGEMIKNAQLDLQREFRGSFDLTMKTGVKVKDLTRRTFRDTKTYSYAGPDGALNSGDESLVRFLDQYYTKFDPGYPGYKAPEWVDHWTVARSVKENPTLWVQNLDADTRARLRDNQKINEAVPAAYLQALAKFGALSALAGIRVEETRGSATGAQQGLTPAEIARRAAYVGPLTNAEIVRRAEAEYTRVTKKGKYVNTFPGLHLSYEITPSLLARASYSESIGRPNFSSLIPTTNVNYTTQIVSTNNTGLDPQFSNNYDISLEYYMQPSGIVSLGAFRKEIKDFIFSSTGGIIGSGPNNGFNGDYEGFTLNTQMNGGAAVIRGIEANYSQQFTMLPGWWSGFALNMNYTRLLTKGNYGGSSTSPVTDLANFVPTSANAGLTYTGRGLTARLLWHYQSEMLESFATDPRSRLFLDSRVDLNAGVSYAVNRWLTLYLDATNITDTLAREYTYRPELVRFNALFGRRFDVSARVRF